ncbi:MAG: ATP-binding protein [Candidatus Moranbacteria bacterium]|nr:ATP-binding protein [Candidatus Moranbacteria bacterium]
MLYKREVIREIEKYLFTDDIVVLHGARQVGKTHILYFLDELLKKQKKQTAYIDLEDSRYVSILDAGVNSFINLLEEEGLFDREKSAKKKEKIFVFIDEIQYLKNPSSFLKLIADHHKNIKLIVSGSSSFEIKDKFSDSLVGRTVNFEIFNLSFSEFLLFKNYHFQREKIYTKKKTDELKDFFREYVLFGGYPKIVLAPQTGKKEKYLQQIIDTYIRKDIRDLADIKDIDKFNKLLEVLASQSGNMLNVTELSNTCKIAKSTVERYLFIMENTYVIKLVHPYSKNIRSELFKVPKIYFYDTGLMQILWLKNLQKEIIGNVFETSIFSELVKIYDKDAVLYWRTKDKKEIDFIVRKNSSYIPIEAKLNFNQFNPAAIRYFQEKYHINKYNVVGLAGDMRGKEYIYPWSL